MNVKITVTYLFLLLSLSLTARRSPMDDVLIKLADSLLDETDLTTESFDLEKTIELSSRALALSANVDYHEGMVRSYYIIGQSLFHYQNYNEALAFLSRADKLRDHRKYPLYMAQICKLKGQIYNLLNVNHKSIEELSKALEIAEAIRDANSKGFVMTHIYESLINIYLSERNNDLALEYMNKNKELLDGLDEDFIFHNKINLYTAIGEYYSIDGNLDSASYYFNKSLALIDKYNYPDKSRTLRNIGDLYLKPASLDSALNAYTIALNNATELGLKSEMLLLHGKMADVFSLLDMQDSVSTHLDKKMYMENQLLKEKVTTTNSTLSILMDEERKLARNSRNKSIITAVVLTIILGTILSSILWKRRRDNILVEVEEETHQIKEQLNLAFDEVMELAKTDDPSFLVRFQEVYPVFYANLIALHEDLSTTDVKLCAMTYLNLSTAEIAKYTFVEVRTVQTRRSRFRKKIDLAADADLFLFLRALENKE